MINNSATAREFQLSLSQWIPVLILKPHDYQTGLQIVANREN